MHWQAASITKACALYSLTEPTLGLSVLCTIIDLKSRGSPILCTINASKKGVKAPLDGITMPTLQQHNSKSKNRFPPTQHQRHSANQFSIHSLTLYSIAQCRPLTCSPLL